LCYVNEPFNDTETESKWRTQGFDQKIFTGDLYDMRFEMPEWVAQFIPIVKLNYFSWSVYRMGPGRILPAHRDTYSRFCKIHNISNINDVIRYVIFLEDWQSGHYFEIENTPVVKWHAGQGVCWRGDTEHLAANLGFSDRFSLQLTGTL